MLCLYVQCLSCDSFKQTFGNSLSLPHQHHSDRSKRAQCFCASHLTTSKTVHMLRLDCTADAQDSYVWRTCHFWIPAISWERWAYRNTGHLSGFCHRICKRCTIWGFTNVRPVVMSGYCFITAHSKMVLIWQTLVVTSCRHAHHNGACLSAWHTYNAVTPSLPTGSLYNTNQSRQSSWLHKRQHTLQFQLNYRFSNSVTYLPQTLNP